MLSFAPLPRWVELVATARATPDEKVAAEPWLAPQRSAYWYSSGAAAIGAVLDTLAASLARMPRVWIPDYFCNQSLAPLRAAGIQPLFYPVTAAAAPDWPACRALAASSPPDVFVLVHYFGIVNDAAGARRLADEHGALLLEDAAHVLHPSPDVGENGHLVLYCPHKCLALPDGALLVAQPTPRLPAAALAGIAASLGDAPMPWWWIAKSGALASPLGPPLRHFFSRQHLDFFDDPLPQPASRATHISPLALRLVARSDLAAASVRRRANHAALTQVFQGVSGATILTPDRRIPPYRFVLRFDTATRAAAVYDAARLHHLPVETWPDMPPEVMRHADRHAAAIALRRQTVLFPVHQSLEPDELRSAYRPVAGGA